jgi:hypothetical protein
MKATHNFFLFITLFGALSAPTVTYALTAGELKEWGDADNRMERGVNQSGDAIPSGAFLGYVSAVLDSSMASNFVCFPARATVAQAAAVTYNYLRQHPEKWSDRANRVVFLAFQEAFPCPDSNP